VSNKTCCQKGIWIKGVYTDIGFHFTKPSPMRQDNQGAMAVAKSEAPHKRSRHFRVACHFLRDLYEKRVFIWIWVDSHSMWADAMTKALGRTLHAQHERNITNN
jgi:hypothetical protein